MKNELLILIPTYNEIENVEEILSQILGLELPADILFIDDNSPDGTGDKLEQLAEKYSNIFLELSIRGLASCKSFPWETFLV